jgi:hypothetical protein
VLVSPGDMPPQPTLSVLIALVANRLLRIELLAHVPMHAMAREISGATTQARVSMLGGDLRLAFYQQRRWDIAGALGAGAAIAAWTRSGQPLPSGPWPRAVTAAVYARLSSGLSLPHGLSLRADVCLGTLVDAVKLHAPTGPAPTWGLIWLGGALALAAAFD